MFVASLALELVRSFSSLYLPNTWQLVLGMFLLAVILFLPRGLFSEVKALALFRRDMPRSPWARRGPRT